MYVYIESEKGLWTVGFYTPSGEWISESDHSDRDNAARRIHYLNGGDQEEITEEVNPYLIDHAEAERLQNQNNR